MGANVFNFNLGNRNNRTRNSNNNNNSTRHIENALIEQITRENQLGLVTISFGVPGRGNLIITRKMILVIDNNTIIRNHRGQRMFLRHLRVGMNIDVECIRNMNRSMPPRAQAIKISVVNRAANFVTREGCITEIDAENNFVFIDNKNRENDLLRLVITEDTIITNQRGRKICMADLSVGQNVRVEHATFQTASIPPQTTAFRVQIL